MSIKTRIRSMYRVLESDIHGHPSPSVNHTTELYTWLRVFVHPFHGYRRSDRYTFEILLRPLSSWFMDGVTLGDGVGEEKTPGHGVQQGSFSLETSFFKHPYFLCYVLYIEQWGFLCIMLRTSRCPGQTRVLLWFRQPDVGNTIDTGIVLSITFDKIRLGVYQ